MNATPFNRPALGTTSFICGGDVDVTWYVMQSCMVSELLWEFGGGGEGATDHRCTTRVAHDDDIILL